MRPAECVLMLTLPSLLWAQATQGHSSIETLEVPAPALAGNRLGDPVSQKVLVCLPAGYKVTGDRNYPVLYLLHGFSLGPVLKDWGEVASGAMDSFVAAHPGQAFIIVIPNGASKVFGSYYLNSDVGGKWEDYITHDVVSYIDSHYRTLKDKHSRAVAGHSMGGFAALRLAMLHSDLFNAAYAMSPCCLDLQDDFTSTNPQWRKVMALKTVADIQAAAAHDEFWTTALAAFAIAASPNTGVALQADMPYRLSGAEFVPVPTVVTRWKGVMPLNLVESHADQLKSLAGIAIDFGYEDDFRHIPDTSRQFALKLLQLNIPVMVEGYHGDHNNQVPVRVATQVLPFIANHLRFSPN